MKNGFGSKRPKTKNKRLAESDKLFKNDRLNNNVI